jgi:predicted kinase
VIALSTDAEDVTPLELDAWRAASNVRERVAFAVVGAPAPHTPLLSSQPLSNDDPSPTALAVNSAVNGASVAIVWRGDLRMINAAHALGESASPFAAMIMATNANAHVRRVTSSLSARGACLSVRIDVGGDAPDRIAAIAAVGEREVRAAIEDARTDEIVWASDATRAAEQAAIIALATDHVTKMDAAPSIVVGTGGTRDAIESALGDARRAWSTHVAEARTRVEHGQPEAWIVVASPCGTSGEAENDAGASAVFANAIAASVRAHGANADAWIANDAIGVVANGPDEASLADLVARAFAIDPLGLDVITPAQSRLFASTHAGLSALAEAIAPNRPSSVAPSGTAYALLRLSTASIDARADALRRGPLRVAVIANDDAAHAEAAALRIDRWLARGHARACPAETAPQIPKPGTYAITTDEGTSEVYVAAMVASEFENEASAIASILDGDGGLLDSALGDGATRERSARVLGPPGARAIVIHVSAPASALDAAVAQLRALLDRVRQGAIRDEDLTRAKKHDDAARSIAMRDPRARAIALFRDEHAPLPVTLDRVRAAASACLHDDALVIIGARPPHAAQPRKSP